MIQSVGLACPDVGKERKQIERKDFLWKMKTKFRTKSLESEQSKKPLPLSLRSIATIAII